MGIKRHDLGTSEVSAAFMQRTLVYLPLTLETSADRLSFKCLTLTVSVDGLSRPITGSIQSTESRNYAKQVTS